MVSLQQATVPQESTFKPRSEKGPASNIKNSSRPPSAKPHLQLPEGHPMASITKAIGDEHSNTSHPYFQNCMSCTATQNVARPLIGHGALRSRRHARGIDMKRTCAARLCEAVNGLHIRLV
jgi:hypothetical protein